MEKKYLDLSKLSDTHRDFIVKNLGYALTNNLSGKERSEVTEQRIRDVMGISRPSTSEYDFLFEGFKIELKQAETTGTKPKFQQVKPALYSHIICMLNYEDRSEWYVLKTSDISSLAGKENVEAGKLPLNKQHRGNTQEGQISPNKLFYKFAIKLGVYEPLQYNNDDLNLSTTSIQDIFSKISNIITN
jgi:hypothetical protein